MAAADLASTSSEAVGRILADLKALRRRRDFRPAAIARYAPYLCELAGSVGTDADEGPSPAALVASAIEEAEIGLEPEQVREVFRFVCLDRHTDHNLEGRRLDASATFHRSVSRIRAYEAEALARIALRLHERWPAGGGGGRHRVVIVTAHNGTGLGQCLDRYVAYLGQHDRTPPEVVRLDDRFISEARRYLRDPTPTSTNPRAPPSRRWPQVFRLDQRTLRRAWRAALRGLAPHVDQLLAHHDVLLSFSASLYHYVSRSVFSPADLRMLLELADGRAVEGQGRLDNLRAGLGRKNVQVITLVDDVFDCFARLSGEGSNEVFDPSILPTDEIPPRSAILRTLLDWRHFEVRSAEGIARGLGCQHLVFPTKHSIATFDRVLARRPICYLSSPTTWPKRQRGAGRAMFDQVEAVARGLRADDRLAVLEPRTIDEDRFALPPDRLTEELSDRTTGYDELLARRGELLWAGLQEAQREVALQPFADRSVWPQEDPGALEALRYEVRNHEVWRNRLLLNEAAHALILLHPFASERAELRKGARRQLELFRDLRRLDEGVNAPERQRQQIVYHPDHEEAARAREALLAAFHPSRGGLGAVTGPLRIMGDRQRLEKLVQRTCALAVELLSLGSSPEAEVRLGRELCRSLREQPELDAVPTDPTWPELDELEDDQLALVGATVAQCVTGDLPEANPWSLAYLWADSPTHRVLSTWGVTAEGLADHLVSELLQVALRDLPAPE